MATFSGEMLSYIVDRLDAGIFILNRDLELLFWNQFMALNSGKDGAEILGKNLLDEFPELPARWFRKKMDSVFILKNRAFTSWQQRPYLFQFRHNRPVTGGVEHMYQNCTFIPMISDEGEVEAVCVMIQDVTDEGINQRLLQEAMHRLEANSRLDGLTQLANRSYWEYCLSRECKRCERYDARLSLILFDLDHFKTINDTYGHLAGDEMLRQVAKITQQTIRDTDIAGRYGGEEFGVIVADCDIEAAESLAERLRIAVEEMPINFADQSIRVTISLGVASYEIGVGGHEKLIGLADKALYHSKQKGRNRSTSYPFA